MASSLISGLRLGAALGTGVVAQLDGPAPVMAQAGSGSADSQPQPSGSSSSESSRKGAILAALNLRMGNQQNMWFKNGRFPTVVQSLRIQYDFNPHDNEIATNLGWMLENIHMYPEALDVYRQYRLANSSDPDASFPEGFYYYRMKQYDDEIRLFQAAIDTKPHPGPNTYRILAHTYERLNRLQDSLKTYEAYLSWNPQDLAAIANVKRVKAKIAADAAKK